MTISFDSIPIDLRTPGRYIEFDSSRAVGGLPTQRHRILVFGQRLAAGTIAAGVPTRIFSAEQAEAGFGRGSMLSLMIGALRQVNSLTETWAVASDDVGAGVQATGTITVTGAASKAGTVNLYIAGVRIRVGVAAGVTLASIATAIVDAITAKDDLPVTAVINGVVPEQVDLTARHKGEAGNDIDLRHSYFQGEVLPAGLGLTIVAMSGGTSNPDVATAIAAIGDEQYHSWLLPWTDASNLTAVDAELTTRWDGLHTNDGHAYAAARGTLATLTTLGSGRNSEHVTILGANASPTPPWAWAAAVGGLVAFHGNIDPARPFQTLPAKGLLAPAETDRFTRAERDGLLHDGISSFTVDTDGTVRLERVITTYQTNASAVEDVAYLDVNTKLTLSFLRFSVRARIGTKFPRHKLASNGTRSGPGQAITTPNGIRNELLALFGEWEDAGLAENFEQFKQDLQIERDASDANRVNALIPPDLVNQLRVFAAKIQFRL